MAVNILNRRRVTYDTLIAGSHRHCAVFGTYFSGFVFSGEKGKKEPGGGRLEELFHGAVDF
jgi:hypothetical protein